MVVCPADHGLQADVVFMIECTAVNGAYMNDLKTNYIIPSLEYFGQGNIDENNYFTENTNSLYGIVVYQAADCLPHPSSDTIGPFTSPSKLLAAIDKLELIGGKGESHANIAEGFATTLQCFDELQQKRDNLNPITTNQQKHCILICNSPPYLLPVFESHHYAGKTVEQLAGLLQEKNINLSIISPRKIPSLYKLYEKAGGDLNLIPTKNYAKDPRHLVLLKGFNLKERPISPSPINLLQPTGIATTTNQSSPLSNVPTIDNTIANQTNNLMNVANNNTTQAAIYRSNAQLPPPTPQQQQQQQQMVGMVNARGNTINMMATNQMTLTPQQQQQQQMVAGAIPPSVGYLQSAGIGNRPPPNRWQMLPPQLQQQQQRPYMTQPPPPPQQANAQGSALIAQLTQPPSTSLGGAGGPNANQFVGQLNTNVVVGVTPQQQQQLKMNMLAANQQQQQQTNVQMTQQNAIVSQSNQVITSQAQPQPQPQPPPPPPQQPQQQIFPSKDRPPIWQGLLEWIEKPKHPTDQQKVTKYVPCTVTPNYKDGEPEIKAEGWPSTLIMQLMPKLLIGNIGGAYLKNSKSVLFQPQPCEALESLTKVLSSGFAGCVHFTSQPNPACNIKVLILLYTTEKRVYLGFIPNDQTAFVDRLRKIIQQQKTTQIMRQTQGVGGPPQQPSMPPQNGGGAGTPASVGNAVGLTQPNMLATSHSNQMTPPNVATSVGGQTQQQQPPPQQQQQMIGQNLAGMQQQQQPRLRMQTMQQQGVPTQSGMIGIGGAGGAGAGGGGNSNQSQSTQRPGPPPFENQLQAERQQNLEMINQLKQTLEAAQQQEQQYKSQLERISHMKTTQLQEALQVAQQTEMQFKMLDQQQQQRLANQANPQATNQQQQQRMMRPVMGGNPGLRHLLQQQPQYRQQLMGMQQQQMANNGSRPPMNPGNNPQQQQSQSGFDDVPFDFM